MSPIVITLIVVVVVLMLAGGFTCLAALGIGAIAFMRRGGRPKMPRWQQRLLRDKVNRHLGDKAEEQAVATVIESVGYELSDSE